MSVSVDLSMLDEPLQAEAYDYVRDHAPQYLRSIEKALKSGVTPGQIYSHYMAISPHRQPLWLRLKHCAQYLQDVKQ